MSTPLRTICLFLAASVAALTQPTIGGVVNGASYATAPTGSNNSIAQGSIFIIFGTNLGPSTLALSPALPLGTTLPASGGTSVNVSSGGQTAAAYIVYTSATQVAAILPSTAAIGTATVTVSFSGQTSATSNINVVAASFGIFTANQSGNGQAIAQIFTSATNFTFDGLATDSGAYGSHTPAAPGDTLVIVGTGLGAISGADNTAPGVSQTTNTVVVNVGGQMITPTYAGRSPQFPGEDQINFVLPSGSPLGCYIPLTVTVNGVPSNDAVLSTSTSSSCTSEYRLNASVLERLDQGGTANLGVFLLLTAEVSNTAVGGAGGVFDKVNASEAYLLYRDILINFGAVPLVPVTSGNCIVIDGVAPSSFNTPNFAEVGGTELFPTPTDGGFDLAGPNDADEAIGRADTGGYLGVLLGFLGPGNWVLSTTGGPDVNAFSASIDLPQTLNWTNAGNFKSPPLTSLTLTWSGGGTSAAPTMYIVGNSTINNASDPSRNRNRTFYCAAPASAGKFVVPASIVSQLTAADTSKGDVGTGTLGLTTGTTAPFNATLASGTLDSGLISFGEAYTISVTFQQ